MIDVWGVAASSLWILGLAVFLALLSWAHWVASAGKVQFRAVLGWPRVQRVVGLGLVLFCAGLVATSRTWWEQVLWGMLVVVWAVLGRLTGRRTEDADKERDEG